jgi:bacteriocin-like protein
MKAKKGPKSSAGWDDVQELSEQELDAVIGGATTTKTGDYAFVIDTADARYTYSAHITDGKKFKHDGMIKTDFDKGKNPYYKSGKKNAHVVDMSNLS